MLKSQETEVTEVTSTPTRPVDDVVITTKGLQDRNINILAGTTVENKGKLILTKYILYNNLIKRKIYSYFIGWKIVSLKIRNIYG